MVPLGGERSRGLAMVEEDQIAFQPAEGEDLDREQIGRGQTVPMRLEERFPRCALASLCRWGQAMAERNPLHGVPADLVAEVGANAPRMRV